jgi:hypothetical protein
VAAAGSGSLAAGEGVDAGDEHVDTELEPVVGAARARAVAIDTSTGNSPSGRSAASSPLSGG